MDLAPWADRTQAVWASGQDMGLLIATLAAGQEPCELIGWAGSCERIFHYFRAL